MKIFTLENHIVNWWVDCDNTIEIDLDRDHSAIYLTLPDLQAMIKELQRDDTHSQDP